MSLALVGGAQYVLAGAYDALAPVVGDLVPTVPGVEHALPFVIDRDLDGDGFSDRLFVRFRVRNTVTGTLLHETTQKGFDYPPSCVAPLWVMDNPSGSWLRAEGSTRVHFLQVLSRECATSVTPDIVADKAIIYSADASSAGGVVWTYQVNRQPASFDLVDFDGDGDQDVMLTTATIVEGTETWFVRGMDAETGALISERSYAVGRP
jgi:hypothetical protein